MFTDAFGAILLGALLGLKHATDADHVVAVTAIVARERSLRKAISVGALWGVGHTLTILLLGGAIVLFRLVIPARVVLSLEFGVALMLIGLGYANLRPRSDDTADERSVSRPILVGIVHGLAGSASIALLVLATIRGTVPALSYLLVFGIGTIIGMVIVTAALAAPALYAGNRVTRLRSGIRIAAGVASIVIGVVLAQNLIVEGGLFSAVPNWDPH